MNSSDIKYAIALPPEKAVEFLQKKGVKVPELWHKVLEEADKRTRSVLANLKMSVTQEAIEHFKKQKQDLTAAKKMASQIISAIKQNIAEAAATGMTRQTAIKKVKASLDGIGKEIVPASRIALMFETNVRQAYAAGKWKGIEESSDMMPYLQYVCQMLPTSREEHKRLNGLVYRVDDPIWQTIYPPNGYRCKCQVKQLSPLDIKRRGLTVQSSDGNPPPKGVTDKGWDTNPGMTAWEPEMIKYDKALRDKAIKHEYQYFYKNYHHTDRQVAGVIEDDVNQFLSAKGIKPQSRNVIITKSELDHLRRTFKKDKNTVITEEEQLNLPDFIAAPDEIYFHRGNLIYTKKLPNGKVSKLVVHPDYKEKKETKRMGSVRTTGIVKQIDLNAGGGYEKIR